MTTLVTEVVFIRLFGWFYHHPSNKTRWSLVSVLNKTNSAENRSSGSALHFLYITVQEILKIWAVIYTSNTSFFLMRGITEKESNATLLQ